ncbi:Tetratricopeptide repeat protein 9A [Quaeritorhiza haematococci]|nr:Tetratricopeptide repeat protein 9A [Quaeritorhiza haematococci]
MTTLTVEDKVNRGKECKDKGNAQFKAGNITEALRHYHEGVLYLKGLDTSELRAIVPSEELAESLKVEIKKTLAACYSNMAAVNACDQVLKLDDKNAKAYFRRGQAHFASNSLDKAESDFRKAAELEPNDRGIREELKKIKDKQKEYDLKQKQEWAGMFERNAKGGEKSGKKEEAVVAKES